MIAGLETITRRHSQVIQSPGDLKLSQLAPCHGLNVDESPYADTTRQRGRVGTPERPDHAV
jgi:hypothetical protein